jgi:phosphoribosylformylglycinamidine cyclo-ligase
MLSTFNCGLGLILVADRARAGAVVAALRESGESAFVIGELAPGAGEPSVRYRGALSGA